MSANNIEDIYALTPLQEGLLFHTISDTVKGAYFDQYSCTIDGLLSPESLQDAWNLLVERHGAMRTLFTWEKRDKPLQLVRKEVALPWQELDWSAKSDQEQDTAYQAFLESDRKRGFNLDKAPLTRITLIRLTMNRWRMVWSFHHLVLDGWSVRLLLGELRQLYSKLSRGESIEFKKAPQFRRFVDWCANRETQAEKDYFAKLLGGFDTPTCPSIHLEARSVGHQGVAASGMLEIKIDDAVYAQLTALAKTHRVTLNTVVVAAWSMLLGNYCDTNDVVFGTTVAGRPIEIQDAASIAGLFINTLPMRVQLLEGESVGELFQRVQTEQVQQRGFEQAALSKIRRYSNVPAGTDLFETIVVFENFPKFEQDDAPEGSHSLPAFTDEAFVEYSNYPLALLVVPENNLRLILVHQFERFGLSAAEQILESMTALLTQLSDHGESNLALVSMLPPARRMRILNDWGRGDSGLPSTGAANVLQLIENQAVKNPQSIAVTSVNGSLNYAQLDQRASILAGQLIHSDARGRGVVIICERDLPAIIAIVAALKAGAVYTLLDASESVRRIQFVLNDFTAAFGNIDDETPPVLVTQKHLEGAISQYVTDCHLVDQEPEGEPAQHGVISINSDDPVYVIYTSGSTGTPKGVLIEHSSLLNSVQARFNYYSAPVDAYALVSSLSTDSAVAGIYWTLCAGGNLILPASRAELDIENLGKLLFEHKVSHILCVPSLYSLLLEHCSANLLSSLNAVIVAGENCPEKLVTQHFDSVPSIRLFNEYGPSESCVWASVAELTAASAFEGVTIGRPIDGVQMYILDRWRNPLPAGVKGEIYIGGRNLARGYLNNSPLSNSVFMLNPFSLDQNDRLYRTGDKGRFRQDGSIEFAGRVDNQIKVRGYRVEPGEVEAALLTHQQVSEAVVMLDDSALVEQELLELVELIDSEELSNVLDSVVDSRTRGAQ